jgi:two-component SAPR family response regulator
MAHAVLFEEFMGSDHDGVLSAIIEIINKIDHGPNSLEILNSEGPVLKLVRVNINSFKVIDQWKEEVVTLNRAEVLAFISGEVKITDSRNNQYYYPDCSMSMKPDTAKLDHFLYHS